MKKPTKTIDNKEKFWQKLCQHDPNLAQYKLDMSKDINHKWLSK